MNMMDIRRRMLESASKLHVSAVSTAAHTGVSIASLTWAELSAYSKAISVDTANTYSNSIRSVAFSDGQVLGVGDYLNISINSVSYRVDILGFHHDAVTDTTAYGGTYAGITWQLHDCYGTKYAMNSTATNVGGWTSCLMRTSTIASLFGLLASGVSDVVVPVNKPTSAGNQSSIINTTSDSLFLLSEIEVFGTRTYSLAGEGTRYSYYAAGNSRIKTQGGSATSWVARSPTDEDSGDFCVVSLSGSFYKRDANASNGVAFAFCT